MRLVVLGGSAFSTVQLADAIAGWPAGEQRRPADLVVVLHGRSRERLAAVSDAFRARAAQRSLSVTVSAERDLGRALAGADVVLNQIRIGGLEARVRDESFPQAHGLPGEETMGPGGMACAVRTIPALRPFWAQLADGARDALVINLTNPAGIVQQAARAQVDMQIVTVCDSPLVLLRTVALRLGTTQDEVRRRYVGMNHAGWYVPSSASELTMLSDVTGLAALYQAVPLPYLSYYATPGQMLAAQKGSPTRAEHLLVLRQQLIESYSEGELPAEWQRDAAWYRLAVVPLIDAWVNGSPDVLILGLPNAGRLPWLPAEIVIEGPVAADRPGRLEPLPLAVPPVLPQGVLAMHAAFEHLTATTLAGEPNADALTRAMAANPMVGDLDLARALVDDLLANSHAQRG